ncbi:MAG TPA: type VI secretion system baseplate subunit TssK [Longimicrobiaceae bacterium]|nr:type VI secretion system baseplate subunit TssK [Longimicrobiaceae bacterium]
MTNAHNIPDAIEWHEGMLLAPQHFQLAAQRQEELLHYHLAAAAPFHWGVRHLEYDPGLLVTGTFRVLELEAVMPDGLLVSYAGDPEHTLEARLAEHAEDARNGPLTVRLAVPARRRPSEPFAGSLPRYRSVAGREVMDENTGEGPLEVPFRRPAPSLLVSPTAPDRRTTPHRYVSFPLARVALVGETFAPVQDFVPPTLQVGVGSPMGALAGGVVKRVREKAVFLSEKVRAATAVGKGGSVAELQGMVQSLSAELPRLEAMLGAGVSHPYTLYLALCSLAGRLAAVRPAEVPPLFAPYDHDDPRASFAPVVAFCTRMLDGVQEAFRATAFLFEEGSFNLALRPEWKARTLVVGVTGQTGMTEAEVVAWFDEARIGSRSRMPSLRERRILGAARKRIDTFGELELIGGKGTVLFAVAAEPEFIEPGEILQVAHPAERTGRARPRDIVLYNRTQV